ncbi:MAG: OmpA family protein [Bacteroidia bacterium]
MRNPKPGQLALIDIYFYLDKSDLQGEIKKVLDSVSYFISNYPKHYFAIETHTDCRGDSIYNLGLSQRRADSICAYIHRKHDVKNLKCIGKGESDPVNNCRCEGSYESKRCTEEEHQQNRRTVLKVVKKF